MLEPVDGERRVWEALVRPARKLKPGEMLFAADGTPVVEIGGRTAAGDTFTVSLVGSVDSLECSRARRDAVAAVHHRAAWPTPIDTRRSTPASPGSAAAPTAGLHFTPRLLDDSSGRGRRSPRSSWWSGSTRSARSPPTTRSNTACTPSATGCRRDDVERVPRARAGRRRRHHDGAGARVGGDDGELEGRTDIFIHRGYDWQLVDLMMTNFHLPRTTLLMMIDAFVGDRWRTLYDEASPSGYRFLVVRRRDAARPSRLSAPR